MAPKTVKRKDRFQPVLKKCEKVVKKLGIRIKYTTSLDRYFKGDLNGKTVYISKKLSDQQKIFNLLHLAGHTIQWHIDPKLHKMGSKLIKKPSSSLLKKLQKYEWNANRFGLQILHTAKETRLDEWLSVLVKTDMLYLTNFYKTGKKVKKITAIGKSYSFMNKVLEPKAIPKFKPKILSTNSRNGIVLSF